MAETILVVNAGSSSIKFQLFAIERDGRLDRRLKGQIDGIGTRPKLFAKDAKGTCVVDTSWNTDEVAELPEAPFRLQENFYAEAPNFRAQMEKQLLSAIEMNDGLTPFTFAYAADAYQFLTASAERVFSRELLDDVINTLRSWATETLGASCVSTPQVRIYLNGCRRDLLLDSTEARYHWMLSLGPPSGGSPARNHLEAGWLRRASNSARGLCRRSRTALRGARQHR